MRFVARLRNGHTWFTDRWLHDAYGQPLDFSALRIDGRWIVTRSAIPGLRAGAVIDRIDTTAVDAFARGAEHYIPASTERTAARLVFERPYLFPTRFTIGLHDGRRITVDRSAHLQAAPAETTTGRWLMPNTVPLIRIPGFDQPSLERDALRYVRQYRSVRTLIIDARNNGGGRTPVQLLMALMERPVRLWSESMPPSYRRALFDTSSGPLYLRGYLHGEAAGSAAGAPWKGMEMRAGPAAYCGGLIVLIDGGCVSAWEDFVMALTWRRRALLVGDTTAGSSGQTSVEDLGDGMRLVIGAIRELFPDGSPFEGIGIKPDVEVGPWAATLAAGSDPVPEMAERLAMRRTGE